MKEVLFYFEHNPGAGFPLGVSSSSDQKFQPAYLYSGLVAKVYPLCMSVLSLAPCSPLAEVSGVLAALASTHPQQFAFGTCLALTWSKGCCSAERALTHSPSRLQDFCRISVLMTRGKYKCNQVTWCWWLYGWHQVSALSTQCILVRLGFPPAPFLHSPGRCAGLYFPVKSLVRWVKQDSPVGIFIFLQHLAFAARHSPMKRWSKNTDWHKPQCFKWVLQIHGIYLLVIFR